MSLSAASVRSLPVEEVMRRLHRAGKSTQGLEGDDELLREMVAMAKQGTFASSCIHSLVRVGNLLCKLGV